MNVNTMTEEWEGMAIRKQIVIDSEGLADFLEDVAELYRDSFDVFEANHKFYDEITKSEIICEQVKTQRFRVRVNDFKVIVGDEIQVHGKGAVNYCVVGYSRENESPDSQYEERARERTASVFRFSVKVVAGEYCKETLEVDIF